MCAIAVFHICTQTSTQLSPTSNPYRCCVLSVSSCSSSTCHIVTICSLTISSHTSPVASSYKQCTLANQVPQSSAVFFLISSYYTPQHTALCRRVRSSHMCQIDIRNHSTLHLDQRKVRVCQVDHNRVSECRRIIFMHAHTLHLSWSSSNEQHRLCTSPSAMLSFLTIHIPSVILFSNMPAGTTHGASRTFCICIGCTTTA